MNITRNHSPATSPVLIADDEPPVREFISRALQSVGYPTTVVGDGMQALEKLQENPYTLLISDIVMPELDGIALALKVSKDYPQTKMMMISGYAQERQRAYGLESLIQHVLPKPFSLQELLETAAQVIDNK